MKILQVNKLYYPWIGGVEQHVKDLSEGVASEGHDVLVLTVSEDSQQHECKFNGVNIIKVVNHGYKFFKKILMFSMPVNIWFPVFLKKYSQDRVIHIHLPNPLAVLSYLVSRPGNPLIVMWHSDIVKQKLLLRFYRPFLNKFLSKADIILTTSPNMIENSSFLNKFKQKCRVLHLGISPEEYVLSEEEQQDVDNYRNTLDKKELLFVGRLTYYKGVSVLIEAMKTIDANLTIIGNGYLKDECEELIKENKLEGKVKIIPSQSRRELVKWFHKCDVFVLPSIAPSEAFGIVQLEAMICKKPVVSTDLPTGVPYVNLDGFSGRVVPVSDIHALSSVVSDMIKNDDLLKKYGEQGYDRVISEFTNKRMVENILRIYREF